MPKGGNDPLRRCLVTRASRPKEALVRFVIDPGGRLQPDLAGRLPGRGMWLSAERDVVHTAVGRRLFGRAAGRPVETPPALADEIERLLAERVLDGLGLARRAGQVVAGFEKVRHALRDGAAGLLIEAVDGAADGRRKLRSLGSGLPCLRAFTRHELGAALGRDEVVHAAVAPGALARRLLVDAERLAGFRAGVLERDEPGSARPDCADSLTATGPR